MALLGQDLSAHSYTIAAAVVAATAAAAAFAATAAGDADVHGTVATLAAFQLRFHRTRTV